MNWAKGAVFVADIRDFTDQKHEELELVFRLLLQFQSSIGSHRTPLALVVDGRESRDGPALELVEHTVGLPGSFHRWLSSSGDSSE